VTKAEIAKRIKGLEATLAELRESLTTDEPVTKLAKSVSAERSGGSWNYEPASHPTGLE
jgi:hypothetical protein